MEDLLSVGDLR